MKNAAKAAMAITPTIGKTVAKATFPPWLKPEDEEDVRVLEDWVWGVIVLFGVAAQNLSVSSQNLSMLTIRKWLRV